MVSLSHSELKDKSAHNLEEEDESCWLFLGMWVRSGFRQKMTSIEKLQHTG